MIKNMKGIVAISLAAVVFSGCSNTSSTNTNATQTTAAETTTEAAPAETTEAAAEAEKLVLKAQPDLNEGIAAYPLRMYLTPIKYENGMLTCILSNQTGTDMHYGHEYYLQKFVDGEWKDVEAAESYGWDKMAPVLKDLEEVEMTFDLSVFGDLEAGKYQLVRDDCTAEFELVPESEAGNSFAGMANPMRETDAAGVLNELGFSFNVPENAEDVNYFIISDEIGQVSYNQDGTEICGRMQAAPEFTDISGMYYTWDVEDTAKINNCDAQVKRHLGEDETVDVCLWYDAAPGLMYSVTAVAPDLDGFDVTAVAEQLCPPMQGEAG